MRAALIAVVVALAPGARAATPLVLAERQVAVLEFDRPVARLAATDPDLLALRADGARVHVTARRAGRATLEVTFEDGATVAYDVAVEGARRPAARAPARPDDVELVVGEERRVRVPGIAQAYLDENGVARARVEGDSLAVVGIAAGTTSVVVVHADGARTTWSIRVGPAR